MSSRRGRRQSNTECRSVNKTGRRRGHTTAALAIPTAGDQGWLDFHPNRRAADNPQKRPAAEAGPRRAWPSRCACDLDGDRSAHREHCHARVGLFIPMHRGIGVSVIEVAAPRTCQRACWAARVAIRRRRARWSAADRASWRRVITTIEVEVGGGNIPIAALLAGRQALGERYTGLRDSCRRRP